MRVVSSASEINDQPLKPPSKTAILEAKHLVIAKHRKIPIKKGTIVPQGDALGSVQLETFDEVVAGAHIGEGSSWDELMIELHGGNVRKAKKEAKAITSARNKEVEGVAHALDKKQTIGDSEVTEVFHDVRLDKTRGPKTELTLYVKNPDGNEQKFSGVVRSKDEIVMLPGQDFTLPKQSDLELAA